MRYFFPFILKNNIVDSFKIADNIRIRKLTQTEREEFFGLEGIEFEFRSFDWGPGYVFISTLIPSKNKRGLWR